MKMLKKKQKHSWRSFQEARAFAQSIGLQGKDDWIVWAKSGERPGDIPAYPDAVFRENGWAGWGDWLGTRNRKGGHHPFSEARAFVHNLGLKNQSAWRKWAKSNARPYDIPANPEGVYENKGWVSWGDWLGTRSRRGDYRSFSEARAFVHRFRLKNFNEWKLWAKSGERPSDIPAYPDSAYKDKGWAGWGNWFGTRNRRGGYRPFQEARAIVHSLGLKDGKAWTKWAKSDARPDDIPATPRHVYKESGWVSMGDWIGTGQVASQNRVYRPFSEACTFVRSLGLKNQSDWRKWARSESRPDDIPAGPENVYKDM